MYINNFELLKDEIILMRGLQSEAHKWLENKQTRQ